MLNDVWKKKDGRGKRNLSEILTVPVARHLIVFMGFHGMLKRAAEYFMEYLERLSLCDFFIFCGFGNPLNMPTHHHGCMLLPEHLLYQPEERPIFSNEGEAR